MFNKLNPANLPIPEDFDIEKVLIDIENADGSTDKYMPVAARLSWFIQNNQGKPTPIPEFIGVNNGVVQFKASLYDENGVLMATGYGNELITNYPENEMHVVYQKAETQAIGRCLRNAGYGIAFKDEGDEGQPIDEKPINGDIPSIDKMTGDDSVQAKENNSPTATEPLSDLEKAVKTLETPYPIKCVIGDVDYKKKPFYEVLSACNKEDGSVDRIRKQLAWGTEKGLKGEVNEGLTYPEFVESFNSLMENKALYKEALAKIKEEKFGE